MSSRRVDLAIVAAIICAGATASAVAERAARASPALHVEGRYLRDADGGVVVLRGVNVAGNAKVPPFRPVTGQTFFDPVEAWGMNVVRLLFSWEAYEPSPGAYDASYLAYYESAVDAAASRGLFVVVDFHQDAFSRFTLGGCGDGFPAWAVPSWLRTNPDNGPGCWSWGARMVFDFGMHLAWSSFHGNSIGARTRYLKMVGRVAAALAGRDAVIGYDMLNEPWGDEPTELHRLHEDAAVAIRAADPTAILFVSPHALISAGGRSNLPRPSFDNFVYAPHFYDGATVLLKIWFGGSLDGPFGNMRSVADGWGVPLFVGEFGAAASTAGVADYLAANYDALDATLASGTQWVYTPGWNPTSKDGWNGEDLSISDGSGAPRACFAARPYPRRIAGTPIDFIADLGAPAPADRSIELSWDHDPDTGATEIYVPFQALFGSAPPIVEPDGAQLVCDRTGDLVTCTSPAAGSMHVRIAASVP